MKKLVGLFVKYPIWGQLLIASILIVGLICMLSMKVSYFPEVESRVISVQLIFPGSSPQEIEEGMVLKAENALRGMQGIEQINSTSKENGAIIYIEGKKGFDTDELLSNVKNTIDKINSFPVGAEKPAIFKVRYTDRVATIVLQGKDVSLETLKQQADKIEDDLLATNIITQLEIKGLPSQEIAIEVNEATLKKYHITFDDIANAIKRNNIDITAGALKGAKEELLIRFKNKSASVEHIQNIVVKSNNNAALVQLKDLANVKLQFAEIPNKTLFNQKRSVIININKTIDEDLLDVANTVNQYVTNFNKTNNNQHINLTVLNDTSKIVKERIDLLVQDGWTGLALILILLGLFLNTRIAFWVAFGIPISYMGMFIIAYYCGITINSVSLFGMILVSGILVDDAIVISENVFTHYEMGKSRTQAAIDGTWEVFPSVFTSVFATMVMFSPFFFLDGVMGEMFWDMALVVVACLGISLLDAAFFLPSHLAHSKAFEPKPKNKLRVFTEKLIEKIRIDFYGKTLLKLLKNKYLPLAFAIAFIVITLGLMKGDFIQSTFFPFVDGDNITVELALQPGARSTQTESILKEIENDIWEVNKQISAKRDDKLSVIESVRIEIGKDGSEEKGNIDIQLLNGEIRNQYSYEITEAIREKVGNIIGAEKFTIGTKQIFGKPIVVSLRGKNLEALALAKNEFKQELKNFSTLKDVVDNNLVGRREISLKLKPNAYFLGLTTADIAKQIRQGFWGEEAQKLQIGKDEIKVWVRYPNIERKDIFQLENVNIKVADKEYPLTSLADFEIERGVVSINHANGAREIKVEADLANQKEPLPPIVDKIKAELIPQIESKYPDIHIIMEGQDKETQKFAKSAKKVFPMAIAFLIVTIILTFRSKSQTVLIFLMIPLGVFGAFLGHGIENKPISVLSFYGIIALAGIVVNDSVVFLDTFNRNIAEGMKIHNAIYQAGVSRFRAIALNSFANIVGLYPLILEKSRQAQFLIPMAVSIAWGLFFVTLFTLFFFPCLILIFSDIRVFLYKIWNKENIEPELLEPAYKELRVES